MASDRIPLPYCTLHTGRDVRITSAVGLQSPVSGHTDTERPWRRPSVRESLQYSRGMPTARRDRLSSSLTLGGATPATTAADSATRRAADTESPPRLLFDTALSPRCPVPEASPSPDQSVAACPSTASSSLSRRMCVQTASSWSCAADEPATVWCSCRTDSVVPTGVSESCSRPTSTCRHASGGRSRRRRDNEAPLPDLSERLGRYVITHSDGRGTPRRAGRRPRRLRETVRSQDTSSPSLASRLSRQHPGDRVPVSPGETL